jgi:hypothetical protein
VRCWRQVASWHGPQHEAASPNCISLKWSYADSSVSMHNAPPRSFRGGASPLGCDELVELSTCSGSPCTALRAARRCTTPDPPTAP